SARVRVGQAILTDSESKARVDVSSIGQVTIGPNSRVRLVDTRSGRHQMALEVGTITALITAPPGQFIVNTSSSTATDLGCEYTLHVDEDGSGLLSVAVGWVAFESRGRESFVPSGASSRTDPVHGPGTPRYDSATQPFRDALDRFDTADDDAARRVSLAAVL